MSRVEFEKVWRLIMELWPDKAKKRNSAVWYIGLEPYNMEDVTKNILQYARRNKFFPDLADITVGLVEADNPINKGFSDLERMEKLLTKLKRETGVADE